MHANILSLSVVHSGSLLLSLTEGFPKKVAILLDFISGLIWLSLWLTLAHFGLLWFSLAHSVSLRRSSTNKFLAQLTTSWPHGHSLSRPDMVWCSKRNSLGILLYVYTLLVCTLQYIMLEFSHSEQISHFRVVGIVFRILACFEKLFARSNN